MTMSWPNKRRQRPQVVYETTTHRKGTQVMDLGNTHKVGMSREDCLGKAWYTCMNRIVLKSIISARLYPQRNNFRSVHWNNKWTTGAGRHRGEAKYGTKGGIWIQKSILRNLFREVYFGKKIRNFVPQLPKLKWVSSNASK